MPTLTVNESAIDEVVVRLTFEDLQSIGNGGQDTIAQIPAGGAVLSAYAYESVAIAGTTSLVIDVGTTAGDPDEFIDAWDADGGTPAYNTGDAFDAGTATSASGAAQPVKIVTSATDVLLEVTDAAIASATAGEIIVGLMIFNPGKFSA